MMRELSIPSGQPSTTQLQELAERCKAAALRMKARESEVRLPLFVEFSGSPKSGKTSIIGIVGHFLKRMKIELALPTEGASVRTPPGLRDDWLAFNTWSGCYALQNILLECYTSPAVDMVLLDRGLFDVAAWMQFLRGSKQRISDKDRDSIVGFFTLDLWRKRENLVFLFTADHKTSLARETESKLTVEVGSVMNDRTLSELLEAYNSVAKRLCDQFGEVYHVDTSYQGSEMPSFQQIAYVVADRIVNLMEGVSTQMLLVTSPAAFQGFTTQTDEVTETVRRILNDNNPRFMERTDAEKTLDVQQVVPYALLRNAEGKYFVARRHSESPRRELQGKLTILVGGHAEKRDWDKAPSQRVFEECLQREISEELVDVRVSKLEPLGFLHDVRNRVGSHHLAFIHLAETGGRTLVRRQAIDQEFGREPVAWKTKEEVCSLAHDLDPWSQLVAQKLWGASIPQNANEPTLFTGPGSSKE